MFSLRLNAVRINSRNHAGFWNRRTFNGHWYLVVVVVEPGVATGLAAEVDVAKDLAFSLGPQSLLSYKAQARDHGSSMVFSFTFLEVPQSLVRGTPNRSRRSRMRN